VTILFAVTADLSCWRISILQRSEAILSISAAFVKTTMTYHSPRAMVATGHLGEPGIEISQRLPCWNSTTTVVWPSDLGAKRNPGSRECRGFSVWRRVSGGHRQLLKALPPVQRGLLPSAVVKLAGHRVRDTAVFIVGYLLRQERKTRSTESLAASCRCLSV